MKKLAIALAVALLLCCAPALSDVQRGDRGEEVRYLQWLLFENGWLFEAPDGVFGGRTEQAVKDYQRAKGLEITGAADYALMEMIDRDRVALDRENHGPDYYKPYDGNFVPPFPTVPETEQTEGTFVPPEHCQTTVARGYAWRDSCARHLALERMELTLTQFGEAAGYAEAGNLWLKEIKTMFDACADEAPASQKQDWQAAWTAWDTVFAEQHSAMAATWPDDPAQVERQTMLMLRGFAGALCEIRSGRLPVGTGADSAGSGDGDAAEDFCQLWSENPGNIWIAPCTEHAALLAREYGLAHGDDPGEHALEDLGGEWDQSLFGLYDQWLDLCDEAPAEGVRYARADFFRAQTALGLCLEPYGLDVIARMRIAQFECGRMCELLRYILPAG